MKAKNTVLCCVALTAVVLCAAPTVTVDSIRQDWPWSADVKVGFSLSGMSGSEHVDIKAEVYSGDVLLGTVVPVGDCIRLSSNGEYGLSFDPTALAPSSNPLIADFRVKLTPVASDPSWDVPLYLVYDLTQENAPVETVTPAELLAGEHGAWEWTCDEPVLVPGEPVPYTNLIWTGVNTDTYKERKLAMRYLPAQGKTVNICCFEQNAYAMPSNYYVAVFEMTQGQWKSVTGAEPECHHSYVFGRPVENITYTAIRGHAPENYWPNAPDENSFIGRLRAKTSGTPFDLPAAYQLTYAAQAGNGYGTMATKFDTATWPDNTPVTELVDGVLVTNSPPGRLFSTAGTASGGRFAPSAQGIYDILGNVREMCVDWSFESQAVQKSLGPYANVDPEDCTDARTPSGSNVYRHAMGGSYTDPDKITSMGLNSLRSALNVDRQYADAGFRLVLPATGDEEGTLVALTDAVPGFSAPVPVFVRPQETAFWCTVTNPVFDVSWDFPDGSDEAELKVEGRGVSLTYSGITATKQTVELPAADSASREDVYVLTLTFDDDTVRTCSLGLVRGASEGSAATVDYSNPAELAWHRVYSARPVFPVPFGASSIAVDGVTTALDGTCGWFVYDFPVEEQSSSVSLVVGETVYENELIPALGLVLTIR